jgi:hypothetical protein
MRNPTECYTEARDLQSCYSEKAYTFPPTQNECGAALPADLQRLQGVPVPGRHKHPSLQVGA